MGTKVVVFSDSSLTIDNCFLGMWDSCLLQLEGEVFHSIGQYLYWKKATVLNDTETAEKLLQCVTEEEVKFFGYDIKNQESREWDAVQYSSLKRFLLEVVRDKVVTPRFTMYSKGTLFVYSNKLDKEYGTGLDITDKGNESPDTWEGRNLLGRAWSEVRREM